MKITIELPDSLLVQADEQAQKLGISRDEVLAIALDLFLIDKPGNEMIGRINDACRKLDTALPAEIASITRQQLLAVEWTPECVALVKDNFVLETTA